MLNKFHCHLHLFLIIFWQFKILIINSFIFSSICLILYHFLLYWYILSILYYKLKSYLLKQIYLQYCSNTLLIYTINTIYHFHNCSHFISSSFALINNKILVTKNKTGNSIKGPIISARAIKGLSGKASTAIANAMGEFLAHFVYKKFSYYYRKYQGNHKTD